MRRSRQASNEVFKIHGTSKWGFYDDYNKLRMYDDRDSAIAAWYLVRGD